MSTLVPPSVPTPDVVAATIGSSSLTDGHPAADTTDRAHDRLDPAWGLNSCPAGLPGVSARAIRQGFPATGVAGNEVASFPGLSGPATGAPPPAPTPTSTSNPANDSGRPRLFRDRRSAP